MCDSTLSWISGSSYCSNATIADPWVDNTPPEIILYKCKPHFRWNLKGWFNVKLAFQCYYEVGLRKGIWLPKWTKRSKNSLV